MPEWLSPTSFEEATAACVVIAPIVTFPLSTLIPRNSWMPPRSMTSVGADRRIFMAAINVCPPASSRASSEAASFALASATLDAL